MWMNLHTILIYTVFIHEEVAKYMYLRDFPFVWLSVTRLLQQVLACHSLVVFSLYTSMYLMDKRLKPKFVKVLGN